MGLPGTEKTVGFICQINGKLNLSSYLKPHGREIQRKNYFMESEVRILPLIYLL